MNREIEEGSVWRSHEGEEYEIVDVGEHLRKGQKTVMLQRIDNESQGRIVDLEYFFSVLSADEGTNCYAFERIK